MPCIVLSYDTRAGGVETHVNHHDWVGSTTTKQYESSWDRGGRSDLLA